MLIIETFDSDGISRNKRCIVDSPVRLEINNQGTIKILSEDKFCGTCDGGGGVRYFYAQDEVVSVSCPTCNHGSQKEWDKEKRQWDERNT